MSNLPHTTKKLAGTWRTPKSALGQKQTFAVQNGMSALPPKADIRPGKLAIPYPVDLPFYSATIIQVSVQEAVMATRRKAKGKGKRKKAPVTKAASRRKVARKAKTTSKRTAK
ncbi:MAG: hypothetical protein ABWY82_26110, partial [Tardiphaga sp.]